MLNKEEDLIQCRTMEESDSPEGAGESEQSIPSLAEALKWFLNLKNFFILDF